ncbi:hypothetical protein ABPG74_011271 [Tetrahymena malaccensis]
MDDEIIDEDYGQYDDDEDYDHGDYDNTLTKMSSQRTLVWKTTNDIYEVIDSKVKDQQETLSLSYDDTLIIYKYFQWNKDKMDQEYFNKTEIIQKNAGLIYNGMPKAVTPSTKNFICPVCYDTVSEIDYLPCNQAICKSCWRQYIIDKTLGNQLHMFFKCPFEGCSLVVPQSFIFKYLKDDKEKQDYKRNLGRVYCSESKTMKWCPAPGCDYAVENTHFTHQYVQCIQCNTSFCFKCGKEHHSPCTCDMVHEWELKNSSESENLRWIQLYTKLCPKCRKPIEKNQGCNHMTCRPPNGCGFEFCWLCLGDWKTHGEATGGFYKCNKFENMNQDEKDNKKKEFDKEKSLLEKYIFYFERFNNNQKAEKQAKEDQIKISSLIKDIHDKLGQDQQYLQFLNEANNFLIDGRRCLKWTYCFGFYLDPKKKDLFEDQQSYLEKTIESLHSKIEKTDFKKRFLDDLKIKEFDQYKIEIVNLTQAGIKFKKGILESYESGTF